MNAAQVVRALGPIDIANVRRDALLRWVLFMPIALALPFRFLLPTVAARLGEALGADLMLYYAPVMGVALLLTPPMLAGMVVGFLLLDQRDDGTLVALRVTPLSTRGYLAYRLAMPVALSIAITLVAMPLAGLADVSMPGLLLVSLVAAPFAPIFALALAAFADNKVQGFALSKMFGVVVSAPAIAYFVGDWWQALFALAPTYWPAKLYWTLQQGGDGALFYALGGLAWQVILLVLLVRLNDRRTPA